MVTLIYTILNKHKKAIKELQDIGMVSTNLLRDVEIFEAFHEHPDLCKECRYEVLAEAYGFKNTSSIKKIIEKLS